MYIEIAHNYIITYLFDIHISSFAGEKIRKTHPRQSESLSPDLE